MGFNLIDELGLDSIKDGIKGIYGVVKDYFPPDMSPTEKAQLEAAMQKNQADFMERVEAAAARAQENLNRRIAEQEGTAKDLLKLPLLGRLILFIRGTQRPAWGFACMYIDFMVFSDQWVLPEGGFEPMAFMILNLLVLGFLFGERTLINLKPLIESLWGKK